MEFWTFLLSYNFQTLFRLMQNCWPQGCFVDHCIHKYALMFSTSKFFCFLEWCLVLELYNRELNVLCCIFSNIYYFKIFFLFHLLHFLSKILKKSSFSPSKVFFNSQNRLFLIIIFFIFHWTLNFCNILSEMGRTILLENLNL